MTAAPTALISGIACPAGSGSLDRLVRLFRAGKDGNPMRMLPLRRLPTPIEPIVGGAARASQCSDNLSRREAGNVVSKSHEDHRSSKIKIGNAENNACLLSAMPTM